MRREGERIEKRRGERIEKRIDKRRGEELEGEKKLHGSARRPQGDSGEGG